MPPSACASGPKGRATAAQLYPQTQCRYLPYDRRDWVEQFLREHRPRFGVLMETEIWANLISGCRNQRIPLFLANARLSEKSQRNYQKIPGLIRPALRQLTAICAQTPADAERLQQLGAPAPSSAATPNTTSPSRPNPANSPPNSAKKSATAACSSPPACAKKTGKTKPNSS